MIEIDGVRRELERPVTEAGDYISDTYERVIDHATAPELSNLEAIELARDVSLLNRNLATTSSYLIGRTATGFVGDEYVEARADEAYDNTIAQLNTLTAGAPGVEELRPIITDVQQRTESSPFFKWR